MSRAEIIEKTLSVLNRLPESKGEEIADFANFIMQRFDEQNFQNHVQQVLDESGTFDFLNDDEDIYTLDDLKEKY